MGLTAKLSDEVNREYREANFCTLQKSLNDIIKKENFTEYQMEIKDLSTDGDNFLGTLYEVNIKGRKGESEKELSLFVKEKLVWKNITLFKSDQIYANEEFMYKELSKILFSLQDQANVPEADRFKIAKGYDETNNDAIILENLCKQGYRRCNKKESGSLKFYQLGVQELAKLHALSFVMEKRMPKYYKEKVAVLNTPFTFNDDFFQIMRKVLKYLANLYENETKVKLENFIQILKAKLQNYQSDKTTICTLSHGDYRKSNCMVRSNDGEVEDLIIIDYQFMDSGCPMRDLLLFIIYGSDRDFRKSHLNDLKNLYFVTMKRFLTYFDIDVETVFPKQEFVRISKEWMEYALMMYIYFSVYMITPDGGLDMQNLTLKELPYLPDKANEEVIRQVIDDFVEWGYL